MEEHNTNAAGHQAPHKMGIEEQLEAQLAEMEAAGPSLEDLLEGSVEEALEELLKVNTAEELEAVLKE